MAYKMVNALNAAEEDNATPKPINTNSGTQYNSMLPNMVSTIAPDCLMALISAGKLFAGLLALDSKAGGAADFYLADKVGAAGAVVGIEIGCSGVVAAHLYVFSIGRAGAA